MAKIVTFPAPTDKGPWRACTAMVDGIMRVFVESDDFEHDVGMRVSGDFYCLEQKLAYGHMIAEALNKAGPLVSPLTKMEESP